jgi:hypothetical protein
MRITLCYMQDREKYRLWLPHWPGDTFLVISKTQFDEISKLHDIFTLVDKEDEFFNG